MFHVPLNVQVLALIAQGRIICMNHNVPWKLEARGDRLDINC